MNLLPTIVQAELASNPFDQFLYWYDWIKKQKELKDPNAMIVATVDKSGEPLQRTVLLKSYKEGSFTFFTNYQSEKGQHLLNCPSICLLFPWHNYGGQIIIKGKAVKTSREVSDSYIKSRALESQIASYVSEQSRPVQNNSRQEMLAKFQGFKDSLKGSEPPLPEFWGGFEVQPHYYEFWQAGEHRLHDRFKYVLEQGQWVLRRYWP